MPRDNLEAKNIYKFLFLLLPWADRAVISAEIIMSSPKSAQHHSN